MTIPRNYCWGILLFLATGGFAPALYAQDPAAKLIHEKMSAIVTVESMGAAGFVERKEATVAPDGRLTIHRRTHPVRYERSGSGIFIDARGGIIANAHTVGNAPEVYVTLPGGSRFRARVTGRVPNSDLVFLSVPTSSRTSAVSFANSDKIAKDQTVYAIGHSLWHQGAIFRGKVTGVAFGMIRGAPHIAVIQAVFGSEFYLGDSGSPLFNSKGQLLGMVVGGRRDGDKAVFAIASNVITDACRKQALESSVFPLAHPLPNPAGSFLSRMRQAGEIPARELPAF